MKTFLNKNKTIFTVLLSFVIALMFVIGYGLTASANTTVNASPAEPTITINAYVVDAQNPTLQSKSLKAGDEFQIKYVVSQNDGVDALDLTLSYDESKFTLDNIVVNADLLGAATPNGDGAAHFVVENATSRNGAAYPDVIDATNGDVLVTATFTVNNNVTSSINEISLAAASKAYAIVAPANEEEQATHKEVGIIKTSATINLRTDFKFSVADVTRTYNKASELNADIIANRITIPQAEQTAANNGITLPTFIVHWFEAGTHYAESTDITGALEIENATGSQTNVGARFFSIEVVGNDFYNGATYFEEENNEIILHDARHFYEGEETGDQHTGYYLVEPKAVTIQIAPKTVPYQAFTANEITAFVTNSQNYAVNGIITGDPALTITAVDSQYVLSALPGDYPYVRAHDEADLPITTNYDTNTNYRLTVSGNLTIGKLQLNMETTEYVEFSGANVEYNGAKHTIAVSYPNNVISQDLANALTVTYTGGEDGANGRTNVGSSAITATFAIKNDYANRYEFVKVDNVTKNVKTATLTITSQALTQEQVDALVAQYVAFYAVDNGTENALAIANQAGAYTRDYNGNPAYIGVVVDSNNNEALSTTVRYKVGNTAYNTYTAALASFAGFARTNAGVDTVYVEFLPTSNYAFEQGVDAEYVITLTINKLALTIKATATATYGDADAVITVDNGTGWLDGESYATYNTSAEALKQYVATGYGYGDNAGAERDVVWDNDAEEYAELKLYNYNVTLTTEDLVVAKKVINLNSEDFTFAGYEGEYDGASHNLTVTIAQAQQGLVTYEITQKAAVKDVADSGEYTATFALTDATNYAFADDDNTLTAEVEITPKTLTIGVQYTATTATFTMTGLAGETVDVLAGLTYRVNNAPLAGNVYTTTGTGTFTVSASYTNTNYTVEDEELLAVYELTFNKGCNDTVAGMPQGGFYFAGQAITAPASNPTRNHYTFNAWVTESEGSTAFAFASGLSANATAYAKWNDIAQHKLSYVIVYGDGNASEEVVVGNFYEDDTITYATLPELLERDWFRTEKWFTNQTLTAKFANGTHLNADTIVYAGYKFNIGLGDVNADGKVKADDITLYRQRIVGGYTMEVVAAGEEWATVTANDYNKTLVYFLERVADTNAQTLESETLGDGSRDIRDVSTIRMALVGGYGFAIVEQNGVTGAELAISRKITIDTLQKMLMIAQSGKTVTLAQDQDMEDADFDGVITKGRSNITIDLGGNTITLNSLNIALAQNETKTITIRNGRINTAEGFSVLAPAGNVVFEDLTVYEAGEQIQLQAASSSLHFNGAVKFYKAPLTPAVVEIPVTTHVVVEEQSTLIVAHIEVIAVEAEEEATEEAPTALKIEVKSQQEAPIIVIGTVEKTGDLTETNVTNYVCYVMNGQAKQYYTSLETALATGKTVHLVADILPENAVALNGSATIEGHDHKLKANIAGNGTVTLNDVWTTNITVAQNNGFTGTLIFNGGVLDTDRPGTDDADAAFYSRKNPNATFEFHDMTISANITKGIKIYNAKSVVIDGCEFDATKLNIIANELNSNIQSLSLVDIQIDNYATDITITDSTFIGAPQGSIAVPESVYGFGEIADSDTGAAIKIKAEKGMHFGNVTITGNTFEGNYRDIVLGTGPYANQLQTAAATASNGRSAEGLQYNKADVWTIANNTTDLTAATVAGRGVATLSYIGGPSPFNKYTTRVGNVGEIKGGVAIWTIANAFEKVDGVWYYVENGNMYSVAVDAGKAVLAQVEDASAFYTMNDNDRVYYSSLQEAVNAANGETTIYLAMNTSGNGVIVPENSNITFDFDGHTYIVNGELVGSTGTETLGFQLLKGSNVTFKNGTLKTVNAKMILQNYANTTLDNFTVSGEGAARLLYVTSNNFGSMTVKAGSKILAYGNQVAFDLWYGMNPVYNDGVAVTLKAGSEVRGKVEYGADSKITTPFTDKAVLTVEDGADWDEVVYLTSNIRLNTPWVFNFDCTLNLSGRTITSTYCALYANSGATLTVAGNGNVIAQEACVMAFDGSTVVINGGTYTAYDNFVFGTNGTAGLGGNTITINAGTFNGGIQSSGYVACGIYVANNDTVVVNGGTFNITDGAGIVARAGNVTVGENVVFNMLGESEASGKVGDARIVIPCKAVLVVDLAANYPGYDANTFAFTNNSNYEVYALVDSEASLNAIKDMADKIVLAANIECEEYLPFYIKDVIFDLNGHNINFADYGFSTFGVELTINGNGTITSVHSPLYASYGSTIIVNGGTYISTESIVVWADQASAVVLNNGIFRNDNDYTAVWIEEGSSITIENATIESKNAAILIKGGSSATIKDGTFTSHNNFVIGTNGSNGEGKNTIIINGGVFNGSRQSEGYAACGIYVANDDTVVVNGGTFNITNGVGILARSGNTTVGANVVFNVTGNGTLGKVGDSKVTVPAGEVLVVDYAANYPGGTPTLTNNTSYTVHYVANGPTGTGQNPVLEEEEEA